MTGRDYQYDLDVDDDDDCGTTSYLLKQLTFSFATDAKGMHPVYHFDGKL